MVHVNAIYTWHDHLSNTSDTLLIGLTDFVGGELEIHEDGVHAVSGRTVRFDGTRRHRTRPFVGLRVTLVAFS